MILHPWSPTALMPFWLLDLSSLACVSSLHVPPSVSQERTVSESGPFLFGSQVVPGAVPQEPQTFLQLVRATFPQALPLTNFVQRLFFNHCGHSPPLQNGSNGIRCQDSARSQVIECLPCPARPLCWVLVFTTTRGLCPNISPPCHLVN